MRRARFSLSSDQMELLLEFESSRGLSHLSEIMARDASVVSRNLQKIAEEFPVLKKVKGRWEITPLGIEINRSTRDFLNEQSKLFAPFVDVKQPSISLWSEKSILIIINAQKGLSDATQSGRNNLFAEDNILRILNHWRKMNRTVVHVKHVSNNPASVFFRDSRGAEFIENMEPLANETVVEKMKSSAFSDTNLESVLDLESCSNVVIVGFTANECIDATARDFSAKGFDTYVIGDATASFDLRDTSGKLVKAERIHKLTLININAFYAQVIYTDQALG